MKTYSFTDAEVEKVREAFSDIVNCQRQIYSASSEGRAFLKRLDEALSILSSAHVVDAEPVADLSNGWPVIQHDKRPKMADAGGVSLKKDIKTFGAAETIGMYLKVMALTSPSGATHAGMLWALYECVTAMLTAAPSNTATVQIDERAEFEKWLDATNYTKSTPWGAWQARASLGGR